LIGDESIKCAERHRLDAGGLFSGMARGEPRRTIGHARAGGETALTVHCLGCCHQAVKTFEGLKLWKDMIFVDVPKHRHFVCT
jgi:hypothetical protein